jgi:hypothetical protein
MTLEAPKYRQFGEAREKLVRVLPDQFILRDHVLRETESGPVVQIPLESYMKSAEYLRDLAAHGWDHGVADLENHQQAPVTRAGETIQTLTNPYRGEA